MGRDASILRRWDPFLLMLIAVVAAASLLPVRGVAAAWTQAGATLAVALLFFLHGAKLSRTAIVQGVRNWRLHLLVLGITYILFPLVGLALVSVARPWSNPLLLSGLLYLALLPSTVQSSIAFTAIARGNVAAAVCSASLSNLIGIFLTPLLVAIFLDVGGGGVSASQSLTSTALQLLAPFLAGHLLRPLIGSFVDQHKAMLQPVDRGSILVVVYSAFSAAVVGGIWHQISWTDLVELVVLSAVMLAIVMGVNVLVARAAHLPLADAIVLQFCGSKKSLASGVPMAGALFPAPQVGLVVLPLMIFHQVQLFVCAVLASRYQREAEARATTSDARPPRTEAEVAAAAVVCDLPIPHACLPGVLSNLALLDSHAVTLLGPELAGHR